MMTRRELWENREQILHNTRNLIERVKSKKTKFKEQTKKMMKESSEKGKGLGTSPEEWKKIQWVLQNKMIPMVRKIGELQKDIEFLDSTRFGKWDIPKDELNGKKNEGQKRRSLREDIIDRFRPEDLQVKKWKEGSSHPTSKVVGSPLQFTQYSLPYVLSDTGTKTFYDFIERKHPNDFVWGWKDNQQTIVMVLKNPSQRGLEVNGISRRVDVVSEVIQDELGDDYQEVRPSPHQGWRQYLSRGRRSDYYPKDTITLIWKYKSTDSAKRKKEEELKKRFPNKKFTWMDFPNISLSILGIE